MTGLTALDTTGFAPIDLGSIERTAALQTRIDRKYVVSVDDLGSILDDVVAGEHAVSVLEIDGDRSFRYRSTYFDTPDLATYRAAATGRARRCKLRTRSYVATGSTWLEVKLRDRSGRTDKHRIEHPTPWQLDARATSYLDRFDVVRPLVPQLGATMETGYRRMTLVVSDQRGEPIQRVTIDTDVACRRPDGTTVASLDHLAIVETKSPTSRPGPVDRASWHAGHRPTSISKYALGIAVAHPELASNRWHRVLQRFVTPATARPASHHLTPHTPHRLSEEETS